MRRSLVAAAATLALLTTASGCVVRGKGRLQAYAVDAAATSLGIWLAVTAQRNDDGEDDIGDVSAEHVIRNTGIALAAVGVVGGVLNYRANSDLELPPPPPPAPLPPAVAIQVTSSIVDAPAWASGDAVRMTRQARAAASRGSCRAVLPLADRVEAADPRYFQEVFALEPSLAACLVASGWRRVDVDRR